MHKALHHAARNSVTSYLPSPLPVGRQNQSLGASNVTAKAAWFKSQVVILLVANGRQFILAVKR